MTLQCNTNIKIYKILKSSICIVFHLSQIKKSFKDKSDKSEPPPPHPPKENPEGTICSCNAVLVYDSANKREMQND